MNTRAEEQREEQRQPKEGEASKDGSAEGAPRKQHGDALIDGTGTRHGVQDAETRPET